MISGNQKHQLENQIRDLIYVAIEYGRRQGRVHANTPMQNIKASNSATALTNKIVSLFVDNPENHGPIGMLRGYIRRVREPLSYQNEMVGTRVANTRKDMQAFEVLNQVLGVTKRLMNGENILSAPICKYEDKEEKFYCLEQVDHGYKYCYDHWLIVMELEKNGELDGSS